jgi:hypothetical protein
MTESAGGTGNGLNVPNACVTVYDAKKPHWSYWLAWDGPRLKVDDAAGSGVKSKRLIEASAGRVEMKGMSVMTGRYEAVDAAGNVSRVKVVLICEPE